MNHIVKKAVYCLPLFLLLCKHSLAQSTKVNNDADAAFKTAADLYLQGRESIAYPMLSTQQKQNTILDATTAMESRYLLLKSRLKLDDAGAEKEAINFIEITYSEPHGQMLSFHLGEYFYRKQHFEQALSFYERAKVANLTNDQLSDLKFHQGYGYFVSGRSEEAEPLFNAIRQIKGDKNYYNANYYYGFILFNNKRYDEALEAFRIVENNNDYKTIVPYYIGEIYYFQNRKEMALSYALESLAKGNQYYEPELKQLIGHIYFEEKQYERAVPYLEAYVREREKVSREDLYELSYSYYATGQWSKSATGFKQLGGQEDALAQSSMYLLADAYLKMNDKANARNAFLFSSQNNNNESQKEIARFNYAKLSHDLGFHDVAITELKNFLNNYRSSAYRTEATELLVAALANTNNFREALSMSEQIGTGSEVVQKVYPRILYGRAVELVNDRQLSQAKTLIDRIFTLPYNEKELQPAYFWKGEIDYRLGNYTLAINALNKYLQNPQSYGEVNAANARYNLGYAYMRAENYSAALNSFLQIGGTATSADPLKQDAYIRTADAYFMLKQYAKASAMYDEIIKNNGRNADYAYYQKAVIAGAHGKTDERIKYLQQFNQRYGSSTLAAEANMQMADAYMLQENYNKAIEPLNKIIGSNAEELHPQAYLKLGVSYFNSGNNTRALAAFQSLVSKYPHSEESNDATDYVKNIFVAQNRPNDYVAFMRQHGKQVSFSERDSLSFITPLNAYSNEDFANGKTGFENYIAQYPEGQYTLDAHYYLADILNRNKDFGGALQHYKYVADRAPNKFDEEALLETARIYYFQNQDYTDAAKYYQSLKNIATNADFKLESMRGLLRSHYKLQQWQQATQNANDLLLQKSIAADDRQIANMILAKDMERSNADKAELLAAYKKVYDGGRNEYAAEARYRAAKILTEQGKYSQAEKAAFEVINKSGSYDYWITSAYILLGEIYFKQKDYFNAEATLKSVAGNASNKELASQARALLAEVTREKQRNSKVR